MHGCDMTERGRGLGDMPMFLETHVAAADALTATLQQEQVGTWVLCAWL